ncbi:ceramide glucosyltransferase [Trichoderma arundinaceum]|uniref:Ceramide glucosyltransferase n=1 Tax=Trichoderma arundinaceum TaxID=490622 RepID=A0A395NTM5_TRIAR|nr:ceramide glucosyltransferase [Trichoderma arundinaceum]
MTSIVEAVATVCLVWAVAIVFVQTVGISAIFRFFSRRAPPSVSSKLGGDAPSVTIIRPVKGLEPCLYECIASTFRQNYPREKVSIRLCVEDTSDPAYPVLERLIKDFPSHDAQILVENEDPILHGPEGRVNTLGPNPKIRNISRAYREAAGEVIWIIDCNVWVASGVLGRMVDKLMGYTAAGAPPARPYKFVHQLPVVVDVVDYQQDSSAESQRFLGTAAETSALGNETLSQRLWKNGGGRLDEMFMATTHVKFYGAINIVGIAPCIVGKSNMFRKAHLDQVTDPAQNPILPRDNERPRGVDYFSHNICEDHLIGDLLWRSKIPGYSNHGIAWSDLVLQPMAGMSVSSYAARRVRWLRARKFTVLAATLVEPGVESFLCCAYFAFALTTLPWFNETFGIPQTWSAMALIWTLSILAWMTVDWHTFKLLHTGCTIETDQDTPKFAFGSSSPRGLPRRRFLEWLPAWIGREALALPIWTWAVLLGTTVNWRGKVFHVRLDTSVEELPSETPARTTRTPELERARQSSKDRLD